jgi:hypothetical protein
MNVLCIIDSTYQSGAFWRSTGPFAELRKTMDLRVLYASVENLRWIDVAGSDIIFMHRPFHQEHKRIYDLAKTYCVPIWIDIDDLITQIPLDNTTNDTYMLPEVIDRVIKMIHNADVVSVSTNEMKRQVDKFRGEKDCIIIKNAFVKKWWGWRDVKKRAPAKRVLWRGSTHHQKDLMHVKDDIIRVANKFKDFEFFFVGFKPWFILEATENCVSVSSSEITTYFHNLHGVRPDIVMTPLADNMFNRCKSNIAMIEGSMAGGVIVAPDWEEWRHPGVMNYTNFGETLEKACQLAEDDLHLIEMEKTWNHIEEEFEITQWNHKRRLILNFLARPNESNIHFFYEMVATDQLICSQNKQPDHHQEEPPEARPLQHTTNSYQELRS